MLELLWRMGWQVEYSEQVCEVDCRPNWSGFMQHVVRTDGEYSNSAEVMFLPIIDLNPSDRHCMYSTLCFIDKQAKLLGIPNPCITFDAPL